MKQKLAALLVIFNILFCLCLPCSAGNDSAKGLNIVFTGNINSHIENFAFIADYISNERSVNPDTIALDCGNFSIGTACQTLFNAYAPEMVLFAAAEYDAVGLGAFEYTYGEDGIKQMLVSASKSCEKLPEVLCADPSGVIPASDKYESSVKRYTIIKHGGYSVAVFSICDTDSYNEARDITNEVKKLYSPDLIVCLFGAKGLNVDYSAEKKLANKAGGIDLIISTNEKIVYDDPVYSEGAYIVGTGNDGLLVGQITFDITNGKKSCRRFVYTEKSSYKSEDPTVKETAASFLTDTDDFFKSYGYAGANEVIAKCDYSVSGTKRDSDSASLYKLICDAFTECIRETEGNNYSPLDIAIVSADSVCGGIDEGEITVSDIFGILPRGDSFHVTCGSPLCSFYILGKDIINVCEADVSLSPSILDFSFYISGVYYRANTARIKYNRVYNCMLVDSYNASAEIADDKLYRVVASLETVYSLLRIEKESFGLLSLTLRDENGNEVFDILNTVLHNSEGKEILQWKALADHFPVLRSENGTPVLSDAYSYDKYNNKTVANLGIDKYFFTGLNTASWLVIGGCAFALLFVLAFVLIIVAAVRRHKKKVLAMTALAEGEDDEDYGDEE